MTLTQLEYYIQVAKQRSFNEASEILHVTQPSLSMQIKKLEEELGMQLIDRTMIPLQLTTEGALFLEQAEKIVFEKNRAIELVSQIKNDQQGTLKIGIIPTLAPYLIPLISDLILFQNMHLSITIFEYQTNKLIQMLEEKELDFVILATPLKHEKLSEEPLFYEKLMVYMHPNYKLINETEINPNQLDLNDIWLLNDGNCLSTQIKNLCGDLIETLAIHKRFNYKSGSLETLKRMVEWQGGFTIIPELMAATFSEQDMAYVKPFENPIPSREISMVTNKLNVKKELVTQFKKQIVNKLPKTLLQNKSNLQILEIE